MQVKSPFYNLGLILSLNWHFLFFLNTVVKTRWFNCFVYTILNIVCFFFKNKMENIYSVYAAGPKLEFCNSEMLSSEKVGLGKYDVQTHTNEDKTSYMLVIRNILEVDAGEYYCSLTPEGQSSYICDQKTGILYVNGK